MSMFLAGAAVFAVGAVLGAVIAIASGQTADGTHNTYYSSPPEPEEWTTGGQG